MLIVLQYCTNMTPEIWDVRTYFQRGSGADVDVSGSCRAPRRHSHHVEPGLCGRG